MERHRDYSSRTFWITGRKASVEDEDKDGPDDGEKTSVHNTGGTGGRVAVMTIVAPSYGTPPPPEKGTFRTSMTVFCVGVRLCNTYEDAQTPKIETPSINRYKKNA